jgi:TatD DNase family protein
MLHDAHNHFQDSALTPHRARIAEAWSSTAGQGGAMVVNGTHPDDWATVAALARDHAFVRPAYGLHPWDAGAPRPSDWLARLETRLDEDPRATVGEIGLDRWILEIADKDDPRLADTVRAPIEEQVAVFRAQLTLAAERDCAASIHCLHAFADLLPLLRNGPRPRRGFLLHAYSGPADLLPELVRLGAYFSFNGAFLDPRKTRAQDVYRSIPRERLLCETDAPAMLPPQAWRTHKLPPGTDGVSPNSPGNIEAVYTGLAALRGEDPNRLIQDVAENFAALFG